MFVQVLTKIRATYSFIRDLPIGIHTALCSATDQFAPEKGLLSVSWGL